MRHIYKLPCLNLFSCTRSWKGRQLSAQTQQALHKPTDIEAQWSHKLFMVQHTHTKEKVRWKKIYKIFRKAVRYVVSRKKNYWTDHPLLGKIQKCIGQQSVFERRLAYKVKAWLVVPTDFIALWENVGEFWRHHVHVRPSKGSCKCVSDMRNCNNTLLLLAWYKHSLVPIFTHYSSSTRLTLHIVRGDSCHQKLTQAATHCKQQIASWASRVINIQHAMMKLRSL